MAQQGSPPGQPGRVPASTRRGGWVGGGSAWEAGTGSDTGEDYPPWVGPVAGPRWADQEERERRRRGEPDDDAPRTSRFVGGHRPRPGFRSRLAEARARRTKLMACIWVGALAAVAAIITVVVLHPGGHPARKAAAPGLVTTFQPGELTTVPKACALVAPAVLDKYLPGRRSSLAPSPLNVRTESICDWTLDAPPVYRHLQLTVQAYAPSGLASGTGSATWAAKDAFTAARQQKLKPPKATHLPKAVVTTVPGLGDSAFAALQVVKGGGDTTDVMTVAARVSNLLITVQLQGLDRSHTGHYGPVQPALLRLGAVAITRDVAARLH